jgi:choice-of-anchor B domain-containing protein
MKKIVLLVFLFLSTQLFAQLNIQLRSNLPYGMLCSNIGGYVDHSGNEYALLGYWNGLDIIDVTNPANPVLKFTVQGDQSEWREVKTYRDVAYVTTEACCVGLQIVDLSNLPNSINTTTYTGDGPIAGQLETVHALHVDTAKAFLYLYGSNIQANGANNHGHPLFFDISNPLSPEYAGTFIAPTGNPYVHDGYVENDTAYFGHIYDGYVSIVDVSNKSNPVLLATQQTPNNFTHNVWLSDNRQTMFTTDETNNSYLTAYDISDLSNITELSRFQTNPGSNAIVHNTHIRNDFAITSWYKEGVVITDVSRPRNPIEVGHYDTYPQGSGSGFDGDWGVYPFLPSGNLVVSDMTNGLFVLTPTYVRGCYLEGIVTDSSNGFPLSAASVTIVGTTLPHSTNLTGNYYTGFADSGIYDVQVSRFGYVTKTITGVHLSNGVLTNLDVQLVCIDCFTLNGQVLESGTNNPISNAQIVFDDGTLSQTYTTDAFGNFNPGYFPGGNYDIFITHWGHHTVCSSQLIDHNSNPLIFTLEKGYYDDFATDFGWTSISTTGGEHKWERVVPQGTMDNNNIANPNDDVANDCRNLAFVTDNRVDSQGDPFAFDVDNADGQVTLTSPVFDLTGYSAPELNFDRWWYDGNNLNGTPNDTMVIEISNGITTVALETNLHTSTDMSQWVTKTYNVNSFILPTSNMQLIVRISDASPGNVVEGGFDKLEMFDLGLGVHESTQTSFSVYPNPFSNELTIDATSFTGKNAVVEVYNSVGEKISVESINSSTIKINSSNWSAGLYIVRIVDGINVSKNISISKVN